MVPKHLKFLGIHSFPYLNISSPIKSKERVIPRDLLSLDNKLENCYCFKKSIVFLSGSSKNKTVPFISPKIS